jgi:hypothetical protein
MSSLLPILPGTEVPLDPRVSMAPVGSCDWPWRLWPDDCTNWFVNDAKLAEAAIGDDVIVRILLTSTAKHRVIMDIDG